MERSWGEYENINFETLFLSKQRLFYWSKVIRHGLAQGLPGIVGAGIYLNNQMARLIPAS